MPDIVMTREVDGVDCAGWRHVLGTFRHMFKERHDLLGPAHMTPEGRHGLCTMAGPRLQAIDETHGPTKTLQGLAVVPRYGVSHEAEARRVHQCKLREVFWEGDRELAIRVARVCVLFEDLRFESSISPAFS